jgi:hypothetical protein
MLRKYIRDSWLRGIEQYEFERIVTVTFETKTGLLNMVVELFGEGNIIITNEQGIIIQAMEFKKMRDRDILRNVALVILRRVARTRLRLPSPSLKRHLGRQERAKLCVHWQGHWALAVRTLKRLC